jgi:hypothetical protein
MRHGLSKSKLTAFLQCPKRLWLATYRSDAARYAPQALASMRIGHEVGALAQAQHPDGLLVDTGEDMAAALELTRELMAQWPERPLFEATFEHDGVLVRVDLLLPTGDGRHDLHEVKSATRVADKYVADAAIQAWVLRQAGVPLRTVHVRHLDRSFVYAGDGGYDGIFTSQDVGAACASVAERLPAWVAGARRTLAGAEPQREMGEHCESPNTCPFIGHCSGQAPAGAQPARGPAPGPSHATPHSPPHGPGHALVDHEGARAATAGWSHPRHYLDFETIALPIPRWAGTSPFQRLPFQFSCHIDDGEGGLRHESFLDLSGDCPARGCAQALVEAIGPAGAVIAYGAGAERSAVSALAALVPEHRDALLAIHERIVDLLPVVRRHYRHPDLASFSLKDVLATVSPARAHAHLDGVKNGRDAQLAWLQAADPATDPSKKAIIAIELSRYCELDTQAMVDVVERLEA